MHRPLDFQFLLDSVAPLEAELLKDFHRGGPPFDFSMPIPTNFCLDFTGRASLFRAHYPAQRQNGGLWLHHRWLRIGRLCHPNRPVPSLGSELG